MRSTFFFYDLETSGFDPKKHRIMQFAGQRTDMDLNPIGEPINLLVSLSDEILPDPQAILVTKITPQKTRQEGFSEAEFLKILHDKVFTPNTIVAGYNSVRFDDEFMRYTMYRNFYDPYEWHWKDGLSRWDLLDVVRMTRALRPEGINWPTIDGRASNRLEHLAAKNNVIHEQAHDALSDVFALIEMAKLIKKQQPKLFDFLLKNRGKHEIAKLVNLEDPKPFVYSSGRYPKDFHHTTIALPIAEGSNPGSLIVYDLRHNPEEWLDKSIEDLKAIRFAKYEQRQLPEFRSLPVKEIALNKCPAIAPLGVLDKDALERLELDLNKIKLNIAKFKQTDLNDKFRDVFGKGSFPKMSDVDARLYDGFFANGDKTKMNVLRASSPNDLTKFTPDFSDERLKELVVRYKARNLPHILSDDERTSWEEYRANRIKADMLNFTKQLQSAAKDANDSDQFLLQELQLWAESVMPVD